MQFLKAEFFEAECPPSSLQRLSNCLCQTLVDKWQTARRHPNRLPVSQTILRSWQFLQLMQTQTKVMAGLHFHPPNRRRCLHFDIPVRWSALRCNNNKLRRSEEHTSELQSPMYL